MIKWWVIIYHSRFRLQENTGINFTVYIHKKLYKDMPIRRNGEKILVSRTSYLDVTLIKDMYTCIMVSNWAWKDSEVSVTQNYNEVGHKVLAIHTRAKWKNCLLQYFSVSKKNSVRTFNTTVKYLILYIYFAYI